jgi:hemoglobin
MTLRIITNLALVSGLAVMSACPADDGDETGTNPTTSGATDNPTTTTTPTEGTMDPTGATEDSALCTNFGGQAGVEAVIGSFVGKVLVDERINAYFLNTDAIGDGGTRLVTCLQEQVGQAVGCAGVVYSCMDMKTAHAGMGVSANDFNDLAADFVAAMDEVATLTQADKDAVVMVLSGMFGDIVEDPDNNKTTYQVVGRKPGINSVIDAFIPLVAADMTLIGFFDPMGLPRLKTCLVRQVTAATSGGGSYLGAIYGAEVTAPPPVDPGVTTDTPCRDMLSSHATLTDKSGDMMGIQFVDFQALVGHLVTAMGTVGVGQTEQNAILGALGPLCPDIVTVDPAMCG